MVRAAGRLALGAILGIFYVIGWFSGAVVVALVTVGAAVRLGWSDVRKRGGEHGAA